LELTRTRKKYMMYLNVIEAVLCPWYDRIVSLAVCKKGPKFTGCPYYRGERERNGRKEILCSYSQEWGKEGR